MLIRKAIMSSPSRFNTKDRRLLKTVCSPKNMTNTKSQIRALQSKSSPVYKTKSEASLVSDFKNLNLLEKPKPPTTRPVRRGFCTGNSGRINIKSLQDIAKIFSENQVQNVVVVAGAGISTPSGIPDFRTPGTGLYDNLQQYRIPYPEAIFDIDYFHRNPKPFFTLAKELFPSLGNYRPNYIHYFVRMLHEKGMLLRMYTQNIDGLERLAGIPPSKLVEAHGTFATATCVLCGHKCDGDDIKDRILEDKLPKCKKTTCSGMVKPDIVFFGEDLPRKFYYHLKDMLQADIILIMGTSLEVQPFAGIIDTVRWQVPRILFNRDIVGPFRHQRRSKDVVAEGDILETMQKFVDMIGWKEEMKELIIKSEGDYNIGKVTRIVSAPSGTGKNQSETKAVIKDSFVNAIWRQNAKYNLQDYCSESTESSTESESSSESSSSVASASQSFKRANVRLYNPSKISAFGKPPLKNGTTQNYYRGISTERMKKPSEKTVKPKVIHPSANTDKATTHVPMIKSKSYNTSRRTITTNRPVSLMKPPIMKVSPPKVAKDTSRIGSVKTKTTRVIKTTEVKDVRSRNNRNTVSSIHIYKALRYRVGSADLPRLRLREKLKCNIVDSSSNESTSDLSSGS